MKMWLPYPLQHPLLLKQTTEVQDLLTTCWQEVVVNENVIAASIKASFVISTDNRDAGLIDFVLTRSSGQWKCDSSIHHSILCSTDNRGAGLIDVVLTRGSVQWKCDDSIHHSILLVSIDTEVQDLLTLCWQEVLITENWLQHPLVSKQRCRMY